MSLAVNYNKKGANQDDIAATNLLLQFLNQKPMDSVWLTPKGCSESNIQVKKYKCEFQRGYEPPQGEVGLRPWAERPLSSPVGITDANVATLSQALQRLKIAILADVQCLTEMNQECDERSND